MTEPLSPPDCDLRDFAFMPLDVARLRDSDLAANESPDACWSAVLLWSASWHQVPAGSIPNDDKWMSQQTGYGRAVKEWMKVRSGALRGWVECTDGRLYHPVVCQKAIDAWQAKLEQRWRTECARIKKHNDRHGTTHTKPTYEDWLSSGCPMGQLLSVPRDKPNCPENVPRETPSKGEGEGQGQGEYLIPSVPSGTGGKPPLTPDEIIFGYGLPILTNAGTSDKQARSFLGGLRKAHGDGALVDALRECIRAKPLQPLEWLAKALPPLGKGVSKTPNKQEALEARNRALAEEMIAEFNAKGAEIESV